MLGDRNAMLATVYPEVRQTLIAQALVGQQQPGQTSGPAPTGGVSGVTQQAQAPTQPAQPQTQPQQPATGAARPDAGAPAAGDGPSGSGGVDIGPPEVPTRIKAQPKLLLLAATPIRRQQSRLSIGP
jgi:hypothetical protein